jgi:hypothetical protein
MGLWGNLNILHTKAVVDGFVAYGLRKAKPAPGRNSTIFHLTPKIFEVSSAKSRAGARL